jgi:hypothetical protein
MKHPRTLFPLLAVLAALLLLAGFNGQALAATASGTTISNGATVNYQVGGIAQTEVASNTDSFVVDTKVDLTVAGQDAQTVKVTPNTSNQVLTFLVTNTGNATFDFALNSTASGSDDFDATNVRIFVESGATVGYQAGEDTATYIDELAATGDKVVYIVADIPTGLTNAWEAEYHLRAEARAGGGATVLGDALTQTAGADTAGSVDVVFADAQGSDTANDIARDAKHSAMGTYEVQAAALTVTKSSAVISDPVNSTTNPKRIPGAVIEYTVTIANGAGAQTATSITVADDLNNEITAGTIAFLADGYDTGKGIRVTAPNINGGAAKDLTNISDADEGDFNVTVANTVTVTGIELVAGQSATVRFRVTIQ